MKVGNTINGLKVTDVKRVNKLNLIQLLKEVDSYLQKGYKLDVNSARQVGLVLSVDVYKAEEGVERETETTKAGDIPIEEVPVEPEPVTEYTVEPVEEVVEEQIPVAEEQPPLTAKKTTTRSKKTAH